MKPYRRIGLASVATVAVSAGVLAGSGGLGIAAASGDGPGASAVGSAVNQYPIPAGPGFARLSVSAHSDPSGLDPRGHVRARGTTGEPNGAFAVSGPVTCLRVDGNKAAIKYRFTQAQGSAAVFKGGGVEVFVQDNGQPRHGQPVDANAFQTPQPAGVFDANASTCDDPNTAAYDTVTRGNYTVAQR